MIYTIKNKSGGNKRLWGTKESKVLLEFDKNNEATTDNKALVTKLKKLGYTVVGDADA